MGKYLMPMGMPGSRGPRVKPPKVQVRVADLATDYPEFVKLHSAGKAEVRAEYSYPCRIDGQSEIRTLPAKFDAAPFVAEIENGISFGRHCCVIGPDGKADAGNRVQSRRRAFAPSAGEQVSTALLAKALGGGYHFAAVAAAEAAHRG